MKYCFVDDTVITETGIVNYNIVATDFISIQKNVSFTVQISPLRGIIVNTFFQGDFYVETNNSFQFSLFLHDLDGDIITDGIVALNFTTLGQEFNFTYNPSTNLYETSLQFPTPGTFPYIVELGPQFYQFSPQENITGNVMVAESSQVCFRLYTDRNLTEPYNNNLAQIFVFDKESQQLFSKSLRRLDYWTSGGVQAFDMNMFHAPYTNGMGCVEVFNQTPEYVVWIADGVFEFKDNFDPPVVHDYFGTSLELLTLKLEPNTTYDVYMPRYQVTFPRLVNNLVAFVIMSFIVIFSVVMFFVGGPFWGIGTFLFFLFLWLTIEIGLWVFA